MKVTGKVTKVDRPDLPVIYCDTAGPGGYDGSVVTLELFVSQIQEPVAEGHYKRYPVCRLALHPDAAAELFNRLSNIIKNLDQRGVLKLIDRPAVKH